MKQRRKKDVREPSTQMTPRLMRSKSTMTEEEVEKFKGMNWEWYYNCYLYRDEPIEVMCKICKGVNIFLPGEMKKKCSHCGIECHRCEVDEQAK
ncbi:MAG: hypothetical protein PHO83_04125 [Geobacteraceae bacterium]|nr:hypothetical protein [Geobacteraceae bacterium]